MHILYICLLVLYLLEKVGGLVASHCVILVIYQCAPHEMMLLMYVFELQGSLLISLLLKFNHSLNWQLEGLSVPK